MMKFILREKIRKIFVGLNIFYKQNALMKINFSMKKRVLITLSALLVFFVVVRIIFFGFGPLKIFNIINSQERPNLILISIDSLGTNHVSAYGYHRKTTPNIDKLAEEGVLFRNFIAQSYLTPVSAGALHTGTYPTTNGIINFDTLLSDNFLTLAQILKNFNYKTIAMGTNPEYAKDFSLSDAGFQNFNRGFDVYGFRSGEENSKKYRHLPDINEVFYYLKNNKKSPYFLWLSLGSVHWPYGRFSDTSYFVNKNYEGFLKKDKLFSKGLWSGLGQIYNKTFFSVHHPAFYHYDFKQIDEEIELSREDIQYIIDSYDDGIINTDLWLGRFLGRLKEEGFDRNTIIILTAEHGEEWGEHGYFMHADIYEPAVRAPFIIRYPGLNKWSSAIETQVQSIDVLPTILDFLEIKKPHWIEGESLTPLIYGKENDGFNRYVFIERIPLIEHVLGRDAEAQARRLQSYPPFYLEFQKLDKENHYRDVAVRKENEWKLIYRKSRDVEKKYSWWNFLTGKTVKDPPEFELYNLKSDPLEKENLYGKPETEIIFQELKEKLMSWLADRENKKIPPRMVEPIQEYF